ncbi:ABC transporter permease [Leptolyngbya sp. 7M]|uniref:ABC transporter permease n=1 Tax=Leptolyngbya sp. 7M TaxID=2812896 RepID=UPI001B8ACFCB|nr:ABC transporter permease [Leptolyngbya sp. 7M]QYO65067.1 ABC transporter permease [Leptolyngbya sp. 7M]
MNIVESTKMAVKTLTANKLRSALTMLGIIIGNASVITMVGVGQGAQRYASEQFESLGPNVLFIIPGSEEAQNRTLDVPRTLTLEDAKAISAQVPTVRHLGPRVSCANPGSAHTLSHVISEMARGFGAHPRESSVTEFRRSGERWTTRVDHASRVGDASPIA